MKIAPINTTQMINSIVNNEKVQKADESFIPFEDLLKDTITNVAETDLAVQKDAIKIAAGNSDALHTLTIDMAKADLAIQTLVQVRNKALESYNEIMRITL